MTTELTWMLAAFCLTLLVFSYVFGDNPLFRITIYVFIGAAAGYSAVMVIYQVLLPRLVWPLFTGSGLDRIWVMVPIFLSLLLLAKLFPGTSKLGNISLAYLVGAGAAIVVGGAVLGTVLTQVTSAINLFDLKNGNITQNSFLAQTIEASFILLGTISTLMYFHFGAKKTHQRHPFRPLWLETAAYIGRIFISATLGAIFAGVYLASLAAMIDRLDFIRAVIEQILSFFVTLV